MAPADAIASGTASLVAAFVLYVITLGVIVFLVSDMASGLRLSDGVRRAWDRHRLRTRHRKAGPLRPCRIRRPSKGGKR